MVSVVHFFGFVVIASCVLPLGDDTLLYGSRDGGRHVHAESAELNRLIEDLAKKLNTKGHCVGSGKDMKLLHTAGDVEAHRGTDGRFYILDTARLMPPLPPREPAAGPSSTTAPSSSSASALPKFNHLFQQLRPELVQRHHTPLSADAYTRWGWHNARVHNGETDEAFRRLQRVVVPLLVKSLLREWTNLSGANQEAFDAIDAFDAIRLTEQFFHRYGV
jgi:hypothetical protein